jgi:hypothetical protein
MAVCSFLHNPISIDSAAWHVKRATFKRTNKAPISYFVLLRGLFWALTQVSGTRVRVDFKRDEPELFWQDQDGVGDWCISLSRFWVAKNVLVQSEHPADPQRCSGSSFVQLHSHPCHDCRCLTNGNRDGVQASCDDFTIIAVFDIQIPRVFNRLLVRLENKFVALNSANACKLTCSAPVPLIQSWRT